MRITAVTLFRGDIPLLEPFRIATMEIATAANVFVRIDTDAGVHGVGEANPFWRIVGETQAIGMAAARDWARFLVGRDPTDVEGRLRDLRGYLPHNTTTLSAFDMALYDILGKAAGLPLYALLGGGRRTFVTDRTIGMNEPEKMVSDAVRFRERGFPAIKVKVGGDPARDERVLGAIRKAIGTDVPLRIDANQGWDATTAARALRSFEPHAIEYCEQPVPAWDVDGLAHVRSRTSIPIMADEAVFDDHDALRLVRANACDHFNVKLSKSGGIHTALKINAVAEASGMRCMLGCMTETRLGLSAAAHVISARPNFAYADLDGADFLASDPVTGGITYGPRGEVTPPDAPGIGADLDPAFLSRCEKVVVKDA